MSTAIDEIYKRLNDDTEPPEIHWGVSNISKFYSGKTIFLSGATGFMGKIFVEKVLRDCPDLKRLYVLVRHGRGVTSNDKIKKFFQNEIFDKLRNSRPGFEKKVFTLTGDLEVDRLGLSPEDRQTIIDNVDIIVHNGATVRFDDKISVSLKINVLGTKHMLDLAMECKHVEVFVYVSTAYSHCYQQDIEETFYDSPADLKMVHELIAADEANEAGLSDDALKVIMGKFPNSYCYSKAIAEDLVRQYGQKANFAMGVYRPSIVTATDKEPLPGWAGNNNGPALIFLGGALGLMHAGYYVGYPMDFIPVDLSINALLAITFDLHQRWKIEKQAVVYNYGSSTLNPITLIDMYECLLIEAPNIGTLKSVWYPFVIFCDAAWKFWVIHFFLHFIPAIIADLVLLCLGKKPKALQLCLFGMKHFDKMAYFANGNWRIHARRTMAMHDRLSKIDQNIFYFDIRKIDWAVTTISLIRGSRMHILKEPFDNLQQTKRRYQYLKRLHYVTVSAVVLLFIYLTLKLLLFIINCIFKF